MNPFIWIKDGILPATFCKQAIKKFDADERKRPGHTGLGYRPETKRSIDLQISTLPEWKEEDAKFFTLLSKYIPQYQAYANKVVNGEADVSIFGSPDVKDGGYQIQKTVPGEEYTWHNDSVTISEYTRVLTYIWYLNDVPEGGETEFYDGTLIQPKRGRMVLFPATWTFMHRGRTPTSDKYIATGWMLYKTRGV